MSDQLRRSSQRMAAVNRTVGDLPRILETALKDECAKRGIALPEPAVLDTLLRLTRGVVSDLVTIAQREGRQQGRVLATAYSAADAPVQAVTPVTYRYCPHCGRMLT